MRVLELVVPFVILAASCGGATRSAPPARPVVANRAAPSPAPPPATEVSPHQVCQGLARLQQHGCPGFEHLDVGQACELKYAKARAVPRAHARAELAGECAVEMSACGDVVACLGAVRAPTQLRGCSDVTMKTMGQPVGEPLAAWKKLTARNARRFSDVHSTKAHPVEVCGIHTENQWLATLTCDDGSRPLRGGMDAERARVGDLGVGGRCNSIIDLYRVTCPERSYDIYLDGYVCPVLPRAGAS